MKLDVTWVPSATHRRVLQEILDQAYRDEKIMGLLLTGSVARGDAYPGSDLDVRVLVGDGCTKPFHPEIRQGILVECSYADLAQATSKLKEDAMHIYAYLDGRILYDPHGYLEQLTDTARALFASFQVPQAEKSRIAYWLDSARRKILAAQEMGDQLRAVYIGSVTSWTILEGLWAASDKPIPPAGAVWAHVEDLTAGPPQVESQLRQLFAGHTPDRIEAAIRLSEWLLTRLKDDYPRDKDQG